MSFKTVIAIGRQTGSGGREIGQKVAQRLGIPYYDKELLDRAAEKSGFSKEIIEKHDERRIGSLLYSLVTESPLSGMRHIMADMPLDQKFFLAQFNTIREIAAEGGCVIVGRCASYALEEDPALLSVFLHGDPEIRCRRVAEDLGESLEKAREIITKTDKERTSYYNYFTGKKWGDLTNYDIVFDSFKIGIDRCVDIIAELAEERNSTL